MKYGIIGYYGESKAVIHYGLMDIDYAGNIKLNLINKRCSGYIRERNKKLFNDLLEIINKRYTLEDLNKNGSGHSPFHKIKRIKRKK